MPCREWAVTLGRAELARFHALLQRGVATPVVPGSTVLAFLTAELGLDPAYVRDRITTVFLDGEVVDALDDATVASGSLLALSAAMPGVAGATLRRGGHYAAMRAAITRRPSPSRPEPPRPSAPRPLLRVKLFNMLLAEIGPVLLARGIVIDRAEAIDLLFGAVPVPGGADPREPLDLRVRFV